MTALDSRPAESSGALAGTVAVLVALGLGVAVGDPFPVLTSLFSGLCIAAGAWALRSGAHTRIAGGSVAVVVGATVFCGTALLVSDPWLLVTHLGLSLGATLVVIDASSGLVPPADAADELPQMLDESVVALLIGVGTAGVCSFAASVSLPWVLARVAIGFSMDPLVGFVMLQVGILFALMVLDRAMIVLETWIPAPTTTTDRALERLDLLGTNWLEINLFVKAAVGLQLLVAFVPAAQELFDRFLGTIPVLGPALRIALSGPLHLPLVGCLLLLLGIIVVEFLRQWLLWWLGDSPGLSLARQAGAVAVPVVLLLCALLLTLAGVTVEMGPTPAGAGYYGSVTAILLGVLISVIALRGLIVFLSVVERAGMLSRRVTGFATGSTLLFVMTLLSAELGVAPLLVLVGSAAALFVWDAGVHASSIGHQLGRDAETTDSEFVHLTGTGTVLTGSILVVMLVRYVLIPATVPASPSGLSLSSVVALGLVLLSIAAFTLALNAHDEGPHTSSDRSGRRSDQTANDGD
ncbi:MAG: hypothetical protein ABEH86_05020 [Haloarcula sp.]